MFVDRWWYEDMCLRLAAHTGTNWQSDSVAYGEPNVLAHGKPDSEPDCQPNCLADFCSDI